MVALAFKVDGEEDDAMNHPGFKSVQAGIAKREGISKDRAGAILASASRHASPAAKKKNPRLKRVNNHSRSMARKMLG